MTIKKTIALKGLSISLAVAILSGGSATIALANDATAYTPVLTQAEQQTINDELGKMGQGYYGTAYEGKIESISIPNAVEAKSLTDLGINIDFPGSVQASNDLNTVGEATVAIKADFDAETFKANSPLADQLADPKLGLANGDQNFNAWNIYQKDKMPNGLNLPVGTDASATANVFTNHDDEDLPAGISRFANAHPSVSFTPGGVANDLNGETDSANSQWSDSWLVDDFAPTAQRQADMTINGQRGVLSSGLMDCVSAVQASCGGWITPVADATVTIGFGDQATTQDATMVIGEDVWLEVKTSLQRVAPVHTKDNPLVAESGDKVWFEAIDDSKEAIKYSNRDGVANHAEYNLLSPNVEIKPWQYLEETSVSPDWNDTELLIQSSEIDGKTAVDMTFNSEITDANIGGTVSNGLLTITTDNAQVGSGWNYNGEAMTVGQVIDVHGTDGTFTVVSIQKGELVLASTMDAETTTYNFKGAFAGSSAVAYGKSSFRTKTPGYQMVAVQGEVPVEIPEIPVEIPEVPETPVDVPEISIIPETPVETPVLPDDMITDNSPQDLAESSQSLAESSQGLAETGINGAVMTLFALMVAGLGSALVFAGKTLRFRKQD